jgi:hypothetical protein
MRHRCWSLRLGFVLAVGLVATLLATPGMDTPSVSHLAGTSDTAGLADSPIATVMVAVPAGKQATAIKYPRASPPPTLAYHPLSVVASVLNGRHQELRVPAALASIPLRC